MHLIYIAGPYRSDSLWGVYQNIRHAEEIAIKLWRGGWAVLCPHLNTQLFDVVCEDIPTTVWLNGGLEMLERCDAIMMLRGWETSTGASLELQLAVKGKKEIFYEAEYV